MWGFDSLKDVLEVGAVSIALPLFVLWITQRWQDRQRDLQIKTELIAEISELVMTTVTTLHIANTGRERNKGDKHSQEEELDRIYRKWRVDTCVIGSKLHAYFPDETKGEMQIHKRWEQFSDRLSQHYKTVINTVCEKSEDQWEKEKDDLFEEKAGVIKDILSSTITGF